MYIYTTTVMLDSTDTAKRTGTDQPCQTNVLKKKRRKQNIKKLQTKILIKVIY